MNKQFKYKRIKKPAPLPAIDPEPLAETPVSPSGIIDGLKASLGEQNLLGAAYKTGLVSAHVFRMPVGAPKYMPGWKELDFLFTTKIGSYVAVQIKDYEFVHHGMASSSADNANDALMLQEFAKEGVLLQGNRIYSVDNNDLQTPEDAARVAKEILI
jgi:hypothetical protein